MRKSSILAATAVVFTVLAGAPAVAASAPTMTTATATTATAKPKVVAASVVLRALKVSPESHADTYKRKYFKLWVDADGDGCNTREEVLIAESAVKVTKGAHCKVLKGQWDSYYDGKTVTNPGDLDIDHVVALAEAWRSGAWRWKENKKTAPKLEHYANDLTYAFTLQAVTASSNRAKGDDDPDEWLPRKAAQCTYAIRWSLIKWRWNLTLEAAEKAAIAKVFAVKGCGKTKVTLPAKGS